MYLASRDNGLPVTNSIVVSAKGGKKHRNRELPESKEHRASAQLLRVSTHPFSSTDHKRKFIEVCFGIMCPPCETCPDGFLLKMAALCKTVCGLKMCFQKSACESPGEEDP